MKVKIFTNTEATELENNYNDWISDSKNDTVRITDKQFYQSSAADPHGPTNTFTIVVYYRD
jgi:hypothetical protein